MTSRWYLTNDKAVIMIAHRLKTVQKAERIFVLENGKTVQQGIHEEFVKQDGIYRHFIAERREGQDGEFRSLDAWYDDILKVMHQNAF